MVTSEKKVENWTIFLSQRWRESYAKIASSKDMCHIKIFCLDIFCQIAREWKAILCGKVGKIDM